MDHIITLSLPGPLQRQLLILHYSYTLLRPFIDRTQVEDIGRVLLQYHEKAPEKGQVQGKDSPVPPILPAQVDAPIVKSSDDGKGKKAVKARRSTRSTTTTTTTAGDVEGSYTYSDDITTTSHSTQRPLSLLPSPYSHLDCLTLTDTTKSTSNNSNNNSGTDTNSSCVWAASYCINRLIDTSVGWSSREIIKLIHNIQVRVLSMSSDRYVYYTP